MYRYLLAAARLRAVQQHFNLCASSMEFLAAMLLPSGKELRSVIDFHRLSAPAWRRELQQAFDAGLV